MKNHLSAMIVLAALTQAAAVEATEKGVSTTGCISPRSGIPRLAVIRGIPMVSAVFVNGHGPFRFMMDTGSQSSYLDADLALKLSIQPTYRVEVTNSSGGRLFPATLVDRLSLGPVSVPSQELVFIPLRAVHELAPDVQGTLGQDFLSKFDYLLDLRRGRLILRACAPSGSHIPFTVSDGRMALDTNRGALVLDSGASTLTLFRPDYEFSRVGWISKDHTIQTLTGSSSGTTGATRLRIGDFSFLCSAFTTTWRQAPIDGLVPVSLFEAIYVSNSNHYVVLNPHMK